MTDGAGQSQSSLLYMYVYIRGGKKKIKETAPVTKCWQVKGNG